MSSGIGEIKVGTRWQTASIVDACALTPNIKRFVFKLTEPFQHVPGQHVDLRLTAPNGYQARRSYSIASAPDDTGLIELAVERLPDGEVSGFLHDVAVVGDELELRGPLGGHFIWSPDDGGPLLLIGAGSGAVPLVSILRHRRRAAPDTAGLLLLSSRTWEGVPFRDELLGAEDNSFQLVLAITREPPKRSGDFGRRIDQEALAAAIARLPDVPRHVFVCGSNAFVNTAAEGALLAVVPAELIRTERYGGE